MRISDWSSDVCSSDLYESYDELARRHRHIEFWIFPHSDHVILKTLDPCDPCDPPPTTTDMEEAAFRRILSISARLPFLTPALQRLMMKSGISGRRQIGRASCRERVCQDV